jgi:hypothetical protein
MILAVAAVVAVAVAVAVAADSPQKSTIAGYICEVWQDQDSIALPAGTASPRLRLLLPGLGQARAL